MPPIAPFRQWLTQTLLRIAGGFFFAVSGYNKLFVAANQKAMLETITAAGIPFPEFSAAFVAMVEFVLGTTLMLGAFPVLSALPLLVICIVATITDAAHKIPRGLGPLDWLDWLLYLPEVLYALILITIIGNGHSATKRSRSTNWSD